MNNKLFKEIFSDKLSGSSQILLNLHDFVSENWSNKILISEIINPARECLSEFESVQKYIGLLESNMNIPLHDFNRLTKKLVDSNDLCLKIFSNLYPNVFKHKKILTISNSHTLLNIFKKWHSKNPDLEIFISEGRPLFEGRLLAESLLDAGIKTSLITESSLAYYVENCDAAIIGTDAILPGGNVINKTGSRVISILCKYFDKPFFVVSQNSKRKNDNSYQIIEKPSGEIWKKDHSLLDIRNYYFEMIESELITKIITD